MTRIEMPLRGIDFAALKRFVEKVEVTKEGCWEWKACTATWAGGHKYGLFRYKGSAKMAHRVAYEMFVGWIINGYLVDHLCGNTLCVNPDHLEAVTHAENIRRGLRWTQEKKDAVRKTHCKHGHPLSGQNLYVWQDAKGGVHRWCRACAARRDRESKVRRGLKKPKGQERPGPMGEGADMELLARMAWVSKGQENMPEMLKTEMEEEKRVCSP